MAAGLRADERIRAESGKTEADKGCRVEKQGISRFMSCNFAGTTDILFSGRRNFMNQQKIGALLRELRKEKGLTQEKFAEIMSVSNRTVSRWENGNNMPDLDILISISDYYEIDLRELLDGERKSGNMNQEMEETVLKAVDYTNSETERFTKRVHRLLLIGAAFWFVSPLIRYTGLMETDIKYVADFAEGAACGMIICGIVKTSRYGQRIKAFKQRLLKIQ